MTGWTKSFFKDTGGYLHPIVHRHTVSDISKVGAYNTSYSNEIYTCRSGRSCLLTGRFTCCLFLAMRNFMRQKAYLHFSLAYFFFNIIK